MPVALVSTKLAEQRRTAKAHTKDASVARVDTKLEVVVISDVDRAQGSDSNLGWRLDADAVAGDSRRIQFTPPGSAS